MHIHSVCAVVLAMAFLLMDDKGAATSRAEYYRDWPKMPEELIMQEQELQVEKQQTSKP